MYYMRPYYAHRAPGMCPRPNAGARAPRKMIDVASTPIVRSLSFADERTS